MGDLSSYSPRPLWSMGEAWSPIAAYRATDVWDAQGGAMVQTVMVSDPDIAEQWNSIVEELDDDAPPRPLETAEPAEVGLFLSDWLPRKATLHLDERDALPKVLKQWVQFAVARRGVEQRWIDPVVEAVTEFTPDFEDAFDDESAWGPAKEIATALMERGVDLNDPNALEEALSAYNAERLAGRLLPPGGRS